MLSNNFIHGNCDGNNSDMSSMEQTSKAFSRLCDKNTSKLIQVQTDKNSAENVDCNDGTNQIRPIMSYMLKLVIESESMYC